MEKIYNGIYKITFGTPEEFTPVNLRKNPVSEKMLSHLKDEYTIPFNENSIHFECTRRGTVLELPLSDDEQIYGFGLQLKSFEQKGKKKMLRTNADPMADTGDSHAPVPFYVSTKGYGVYIDTARYVTYYCGSSAKKEYSRKNTSRGAKGSVEELYAQEDFVGKRCLTADIPSVSGADVYFFSGPSMTEAVSRYNLFSGGGVLPPLWALGIWYRTYFDACDKDVLGFAKNFREKNLPCSVIGLEPGWLKRAYSASYVWNEKKFPDHNDFIKKLNHMGYKVNLWEHVYVHPEAPIYNDLYPYSGDYEVWNGLVPDFSIEKASDIFADYHRETFADNNISGFKIDECDSSDYTGAWAFPNCSKFPSGMDGEQMHSMLGILYQYTIKKIYDKKGIRTMGLVRSSHALASPYPFVLYSDLYSHRDFIRGMVNMGFSGILWTPEVRNADSVEDLIRRMQSVCISPLAIVNAWPFPYPPWWQVNQELNKQGVLMENREETEKICRDLFCFRMSLIPYLYNAFYKYRSLGRPPFRALVMDYSDDPETYSIDDQFMIGEDIIAAPIVAGETVKKFYLPKGRWVDFFDENNILPGGKWYEFSYGLNKFPLFVKDGALIPLAEPVETICTDTKLKLSPKLFGKSDRDETVVFLYEDDGETNAYLNGEYNEIKITCDNNGKFTLERIGKNIFQRYIW